MQIYDSFKSISQTEVEQFQIENGVNLPMQYADFLLKNNGGRSKQKAFSFNVNGKETKGLLDWFLGIHNEEHDNLSTYLQTYKYRIPGDLIPIAHDPGGNLICLSTTNGSIHFWDHDYEVEEDEEPNYENVYFIANSLNEFTNNLVAFD